MYYCGHEIETEVQRAEHHDEKYKSRITRDARDEKVGHPIGVLALLDWAQRYLLKDFHDGRQDMD